VAYAEERCDSSKTGESLEEGQAGRTRTGRAPRPSISGVFDVHRFAGAGFVRVTALSRPASLAGALSSNPWAMASDVPNCIIPAL
jgi:hypothetical protein